MTTRKDLMNEAVDGLFISAGVVVLSVATKKLLGEKLTVIVICNSILPT